MEAAMTVATSRARTIRHLLRHAHRPLKVSLVVGTVLCLINGTYTGGEFWRLALNYLVPFSVASYSGLAFAAEQRRLQSQAKTGKDYEEALETGDSASPVDAGTGGAW
jgi:hypothetical protein